MASFLCKDFEVGFSELIAGKANIEAVKQKSILNNENFDFIPTGILSLKDPEYYENLFDTDKLSRLFKMFQDYDFIVYDTPPRISRQIESLLDMTDDFLIVLNPDPATFSSFVIFNEFVESKNLKDKTYILINKTEPTKVSEDFSKMISYLYKEKIWD